jgi:hypothetical protein
MARSLGFVLEDNFIEATTIQMLPTSVSHDCPWEKATSEALGLIIKGCQYMLGILHVMFGVRIGNA